MCTDTKYIYLLGHSTYMYSCAVHRVRYSEYVLTYSALHGLLLSDLRILSDVSFATCTFSKSSSWTDRLSDTPENPKKPPSLTKQSTYNNGYYGYELVPSCRIYSGKCTESCTSILYFPDKSDTFTIYYITWHLTLSAFLRNLSEQC